MAVYSGNDDYWSIDGTDVSSYWVEGAITANTATTDVTAGSGVTNMARNEGLKSHTLSLTIVYDTADHATILPLVAEGEHDVIWGPQGNTAGEPKHAQKFIFTSVETSGSHAKDSRRTFVITGESSAAPTDDMWAGDTW